MLEGLNGEIKFILSKYNSSVSDEMLQNLFLLFSIKRTKVKKAVCETASVYLSLYPPRILSKVEINMVLYC